MEDLQIQIDSVNKVCVANTCRFSNTYVEEGYCFAEKKGMERSFHFHLKFPKMKAEKRDDISRERKLHRPPKCI